MTKSVVLAFSSNLVHEHSEVEENQRPSCGWFTYMQSLWYHWCYILSPSLTRILNWSRTPAAFIVDCWKKGCNTCSKKLLCVCDRDNEEVYFHVLRWWLCWDMAQRKTVSAWTPQFPYPIRCEVVWCFPFEITIYFLPQLLLSGNLLWDSSGRRLHWSLLPRWYAPLRQQWRSGV